MNAQELRIGNYLEFEVRGEWKHVAIDASIICSIDYSPNEKETRPIELTPSWLERLSFERKQYSYSLEAKEYKFTVHENGKIFNWVINGYAFVELQYVHQLQNLYFALTSEELTITEKA